MSASSSSGGPPDSRAVLVLGEALVDELPGGPVAGGAPLNVACHLRAFGCAPLLVSRIGADDAAGRRVEAAMRDAELSLDGVQRDAQRPTGIVQVQMRADATHRFVIGADAAWDHVDAQEALALLPALAPRFVYFGCLAQRQPVSRGAFRAMLSRAEAPRLLDLNLRDGVDARLALDCLALADWLKVNDEELAQLRVWSDCADPFELLRRFGLQRLIVTRGAAGYFCLDAHDAQCVEGPGLTQVPVVDTVGAGDAFSACLLAAHLCGKDWGAGLALANEFAAAMCGQAGACVADPASFYPPWRQALAALPQARSDT